MSDAPPPYPQQPSPQQQPPHHQQQPYPPQPYPQQPPPGYLDPNAGYGAPPPGAPGTKVATADIRPKARWFWIGGAIMLLGVVASIVFGVLGFVGIANTVDDFARVSEGSDTVRIDSTGEYVIYSENGSFFASVDVVSPDGDPVETDRYLTELTYEYNGRTGRAVSTFEATDTGRYTITTDSDVAIGKSVAGDLIRAILIPFLIAGLGFLLGLIVIIVTAVRRSGSKKRLATGH